MKIKTLAAFACMVTASGFAQVKKPGLSVRGILPASFNGYRVYLDSSTVYLNMHSSVHLDSVTVKEGRFAFSHQMAEPAELIISLRTSATGISDYGNKSLFADVNDQITITQHEAVAANNLLEKAVITGSVYSKQYEEMLLASAPVVTPQEKLIAAKLGHTKNADTLKMGMDVFNAMMKRSADGLTDFINHHPGYYVSLYKFREQLGRRVTNVSEAKTRFSHFPVALQNTTLGRNIADFIDSSSKLTIGQMAPAFAALTPEGKTIKLTDLRGKYVLVDFWASWCGPCRAENPNLVKAYNKYKNKNFEILGFSLDTGHDPWVKAIKSDGVTWLQLSDLKGWESSMVKSYLIPSVPSNFLIDPQGKIIAVNLRGEMVDKELEKIL